MSRHGEILILHLVAGKTVSSVERDRMAKGREENVGLEMGDEAKWQR